MILKSHVKQISINKRKNSKIIVWLCCNFFFFYFHNIFVTLISASRVLKHDLKIKKKTEKMVLFHILMAQPSTECKIIDVLFKTLNIFAENIIFCWLFCDILIMWDAEFWVFII